MSYYEQRLSEDTALLMREVASLAQLVDQSLQNALRALATDDRGLAYQTVLEDGPINRLTEKVESESHRFMAKHLPSGGHLRRVSSIMRIAVLLERVGDYASTICRHAASMKKPLEGSFKRDVAAMGADALQMYRQALDAFTKEDASLARGTMGFAEQVDRDFVNALAFLRDSVPEKGEVDDLFARLVIIRQLERVSDQAKNLCEETVFAITGETKRRKPMEILVVGKTDDGATQLAAAIAARLHAGKIALSTGGEKAADSVRPDIAAFLSEKGYEVADLQPTDLDGLGRPLGSFKIIVSLDGPVAERVGAVPFECVALEWDLGDSSDVETCYRELAAKLDDLARVVRG
ncbi:MAG: phosphate transport system protein [Rhodothermales bacterium]|jgi:phosphate transport system protein